MGIGGYIMLINITPLNWSLADQSSYQMTTWNFPQSLAPYSLTSVYVERDYGTSETITDTQAGATFSTDIGSESLSYRVEYKVPDSNTVGALDVLLTGMSTTDTGQGQQISLPDYMATTDSSQTPVNANPFILSSTEIHGSTVFSANDISTAWMTQDLPILYCRPLRWICLPGSHDAGMSTKDGGTFLGTTGSILTQTNDILAQLVAGVRYFDIRPVISDGEYKTGHYSKVGATFQGGNGQSIADIIDQVNQYTDQYHELVILDLSHSFNTDLGAESYRPFNQDEWDGLINQLQGLRHLFSVPLDYFWLDLDLSWMPLGNFINGTAAVIVSLPGDVSLGASEGNGFINSTRMMNLINEYSDANEFHEMLDDQFSKLRQYRSDVSENGFVMSWTLTQNTDDAIFGPTVLELAAEANNALYGEDYFWKNWAQTPLVFPNVLMIDDVPADGRFRALVTGMNRMIQGAGGYQVGGSRCP